MNDYVTKPVNHNQLIGALCRWAPQGWVQMAGLTARTGKPSWAPDSKGGAPAITRPSSGSTGSALDDIISELGDLLGDEEL